MVGSRKPFDNIAPRLFALLELKCLSDICHVSGGGLWKPPQYLQVVVKGQSDCHVFLALLFCNKSFQVGTKKMIFIVSAPYV